MEPLLAKIRDEAATRRLPESTYRLQFHVGFTFRDAARLVPYLSDLGVTHCYASPYLKARPGSTHGYDIVNHKLLNPEIGTEEEYSAFVQAQHEHGLGQILDIVPNHMGIVGNENVWWNDVLENGLSSPYASFFDIAWYASPRQSLQEKVLLPILGDAYGQVLESGQFRLTYAAGTFTLAYFEHRFPAAPRSYRLVLEHALPEILGRLSGNAPALLEFQSIITAINHLPPHYETDPALVEERLREKEVIKRRLATLTESSPAVREAVEHSVTAINGTAGDAASFDLLDRLLDEQAFRLAYWRVASDEINYRRFFDVNELAALSMERQEVFEATHERVLELLAGGQIQGLRIDHPDGLYEPRQYLERLQRYYVLARARRLLDTLPEYQGRLWDEVEAVLHAHLDRVRPDDPLRRPLYLVVEKILGATEALPAEWPVHGTSGYDLLNEVNGLFVDTANYQAFKRIYRDWVEGTPSFPEVAYQEKFLILQVALSSELHMLAYQLDHLAQKKRWSRDYTLTSLRHALREIIACFPVYRSYISEEGGVREADRRYVERAVRRAEMRNPAISSAIFQFVKNMLLLKYSESSTEEDREEQRRFVGKFQQVTSPVMAKGVEDTAFYVYNRLLSLNEVGGDPGRFGLKPGVLHQYNEERQRDWPWSFSTLSTHDTKRSGDVRARINVLSEMPEEWLAALTRWAERNRPHKVQVEEEAVPDANEEYFLYQTLLGSWPLEGGDEPPGEEFVTRIQEYVSKAMREAKIHTSWINPNRDYDQAVRQFVARILDTRTGAAFLEDFRQLQRRVNHFGLFNALSQTLLKLTVPGVADTYQGTELWDFSLVDPDNRRPVDYELRQRLLRDLQAGMAAAGNDRRALARELTVHREDGRIKLYVTRQGLHARRRNPGLFANGEYFPLQVAGGPEHAFGFVRRQGKRYAAVIVPRLLTHLLSQEGGLPLGREVWGEQSVLWPEIPAPAELHNVFTGERLTLSAWEGKLRLPLADAFGHFPVALFLAPVG
jgi:(1->4)-alpha-D-glucan 1-alpha-D-glucosylmutase